MNRILYASLIFTLCIFAAFSQQETDFQIDGNGTITEYRGSVKNVVIPATIGGKQVASIGAGAFWCNRLKNVTIPNGVTVIGDFAFQGNFLTSVTIPGSVTTVGKRAFQSNELTSVTIPAGVTAVGGGAFAANSGLKEILCDAENSAYTSTDGVLFSKDGKILIAYPAGKGTAYTIPGGVSAIGEEAFSVSNLTSVTIPAGVAAIGAGAFYGNKLIGAAIPASVTSIAGSAFASNFGLKEILCDAGNPAYTSTDGVLFSKDGKTLVAYPAGKGTAYTIPSSVAAIGDSAFQAGRLKSVTIPESVTAIGAGAFSGNKLRSVAIPSSVTAIGARAFENNKLIGVTIPSSVTAISEWAFWINRLTSVTIPSSVTAIGDFAFCENKLTNVTIGGNVAVPDSAFNNGLAWVYNGNGKQAGIYVLRDGAWAFKK